MDGALFDVAQIPRDTSPARAPSCAWCSGEIPTSARTDAIYCTKRCRQAAHRFRRDHDASRTPADTTPARLAYADPPYPGMAERYYRDHPDFGGEVDHGELVSRLVAEYPDGWALSTDSNSLRNLLPLCATDVRVMAWVKPFASWKKGVFPPYAWEPVLLRGGRNRFGHVQSPRDWVSATPPVFRGMGSDTKGQKPDEFCFWLFDCFGAMEGDVLDDLFPGSSAVSKAWDIYMRTPRLDFPQEDEQQIEMEAA